MSIHYYCIRGIILKLLICAILLLLSAESQSSQMEVNVRITLPAFAEPTDPQPARIRLYNYHRGKYDMILRPHDMQYDYAVPYLPPISNASELYDTFIQQGKTPYQALTLVIISAHYSQSTV